MDVMETLKIDTKRYVRIHEKEQKMGYVKQRCKDISTVGMNFSC